MKVSARNALKGKVIEVRKGAVAAEVHVDVGAGNTITSVITVNAVEDLGIAEGTDVTVLIKATDVLLAV